MSGCRDGGIADAADLKSVAFKKHGGATPPLDTKEQERTGRNNKHAGIAQW